MSSDIPTMTAPAPATPAVASGALKKKKVVSGKKQVKSVATAAAGASHPKYTEMVQQAIVNLKQRGGSSRKALLQYILQNFKVGRDENLVNKHVKKALKTGIMNSTIKQSKGTGATGSFRLGEKKVGKKTTSSSPSAAKKQTKKPSTVAAVKKAGGVKKIKMSPKKTAAAKKPIPKKSAVAVGKKSPAATKKTTTKKPAPTKMAASKLPKTATVAAAKVVKKSTVAIAKKKTVLPASSSAAGKKKLVKKPATKKQ